MTTPAAQSAAMLTETEIVARRNWWQAKLDAKGNHLSEEIAFWRSEIALCSMALQSLRAGERQAVALTDAQIEQIVATHHALKAETGHVCPSCGRGYTSPPSSVRHGMETAAEICDGLADAQGSPMVALYQRDCAKAIRAAAAKLPEGGNARDALCRARLQPEGRWDCDCEFKHPIPCSIAAARPPEGK